MFRCAALSVGCRVGVSDWPTVCSRIIWYLLWYRGIFDGKGHAGCSSNCNVMLLWQFCNNCVMIFFLFLWPISFQLHGTLGALEWLITKFSWWIQQTYHTLFYCMDWTHWAIKRFIYLFFKSRMLLHFNSTHCWSLQTFFFFFTLVNYHVYACTHTNARTHTHLSSESLGKVVPVWLAERERE